MTEQAVPADINMYQLLADAARGSLEAQRQLASLGFNMALADGYDTIGALTEALIFARLAASHGEVSDQGVLLTILGHLADAHVAAGEQEYADHLIGEMLALINRLADQGIEAAAMVIGRASAAASLRALEHARGFASQWEEDLEHVR